MTCQARKYAQRNRLEQQRTTCYHNRKTNQNSQRTAKIAEDKTGRESQLHTRGTEGEGPSENHAQCAGSTHFFSCTFRKKGDFSPTFARTNWSSSGDLQPIGLKLSGQLQSYISYKGHPSASLQLQNRPSMTCFNIKNVKNRTKGQKLRTGSSHLGTGGNKRREGAKGATGKAGAKGATGEAGAKGARGWWKRALGGNRARGGED